MRSCWWLSFGLSDHVCDRGGEYRKYQLFSCLEVKRMIVWDLTTITESQKSKKPSKSYELFKLFNVVSLII